MFEVSNVGCIRLDVTYCPAERRRAIASGAGTATRSFVGYHPMQDPRAPLGTLRVGNHVRLVADAFDWLSGRIYSCSIHWNSV